MNNYQLYRTNLLLGGQMKMDLIIGHDPFNQLYVSNFHLSPISDNMPYTNKPDEYIIKNTHQDNIKTYYFENKGNFYNEFLDTKYLHNWPVICNKNEVIDCYSNIYDMGCKRTKYYSKYNKQFEFFCPVWLEHVYDDIKFKIDVKNKKTGTTIYSNYLSLSTKNINNEFHTKFVSYINDYINDTGLKKGNDDIININFKNNKATITGLNVNTGIFETISLNDIISNITDRERPLMETDNMIIQSFPDNKIICKQLFNFNLCFNIEDIIPNNLLGLLYGTNISISVAVYIGNDMLELKDFYTNYEYIQKVYKYKKSNENENANADSTTDINTNTYTNVLNYLKDNDYIEFINKNKFCQSICHWSLFDNNNYIFNVYEGFSGLFYNTDNVIYENEHQYGNAPNTTLKNYDEYRNTNGWINTYIYDKTKVPTTEDDNKTEETEEFNLPTENDINEILLTALNIFIQKIPDNNDNDNNDINIKDYITDIENKGIKLNKKFINNIKYNHIPESDNNYSVLGIKLHPIVINMIKWYNMYDYEIIKTTNGAYSVLLLKIGNAFIFVYNNNDLFTFANFFQILTIKYKNEFNDIKSEQVKKYLRELYLMMKSKIDPTVISFNKSLQYTYTDSPNINSKEIEYIKNDNDYNYVIRYDGKIKPTFTDKNDTDKKNIIYYKDYISDITIVDSVYTQYSKLDYEPLYPSLNYCAIKKIDTWDYNTLPEINVSEHHDNENKVNIYKNDIEYSWYTDNSFILINSELNFTVINMSGNYKTADTYVYEYIRKQYNITEDSLIKYIKNLYNYKNNWDYYSDTNIHDYKYNISMKLK